MSMLSFCLSCNIHSEFKSFLLFQRHHYSLHKRQTDIQCSSRHFSLFFFCYDIIFADFFFFFLIGVCQTAKVAHCRHQVVWGGSSRAAVAAERTEEEVGPVKIPASQFYPAAPTRGSTTQSGQIALQKQHGPVFVQLLLPFSR